MHIARFTIVLFLILEIVLLASPRVRGEVNQAWEHAQPGVIQVMDSVYATVRDFIVGTGTHDGIDGDAPGVDFDIIVTMSHRLSF